MCIESPTIEVQIQIIVLTVSPKAIMKPLLMNQRVLTWLCMLPMDEASTKTEKLGCIAFAIGVTLIIYSGFLASLIFFLKFVSSDLEESLYALFQVVGMFSTANAIVVAILMRHKIPSIFTNLSKIYDERKFKV